MFWAKVTTKGKTSHAGEPEKGSNSIVNASKLILDLNTNYRNILKRFNSGIHKSTISIGNFYGSVDPCRIVARVMVYLNL